MARATIFLVLLSYAGMLCAQEDFFLNGRARQLNDSCFQLTSAADTFAVGSIWYPEKIDLRNSFDLIMEMEFGCQDEFGADGIVFGLQPLSASVGEAGEGLGIGGVRPALGVEFDTYENANRSDPFYDHIAIMANGTVSHSSGGNLAGPIAARVDGGNIENCASFPLRVTWDAKARRMRVYFDCELRLEYSGDIVAEIFDGDPFVYYGFAAATGGYTNTQQVCFTFNSFQRELEDIVVCPGGKALLDVSGGARYEWSPAAGLNDSTAASVEASPTTTTEYTVRIFDECGIPLRDTVTVAVEGDSAFVDLGPDTTLCPGESLSLALDVPTAEYSWSDAGLSGPSVDIAGPGVYSVTATRTDIICTAADRVVVEAYSVPPFDVGPPDTSLCNGTEYVAVADYPEGQAFTETGLPFDTLRIGRPGSYLFTYDHPCRLQTDAIEITYGSCREYYMPNVFSPNEDGQNDRFFPQDNGDILLIHRFMVFDRWGNLVYENEAFAANDADAGWDGYFRDRPAPVGTYVWVMDADFRVGQRITERGSVTVIR